MTRLQLCVDGLHPLRSPDFAPENMGAVESATRDKQHHAGSWLRLGKFPLILGVFILG